eukprot:NODE_2028_length_1300_cov_21.754476_g1930_i0.p1 GENE.NODE_2028_length_1300_cov_21.754476_g1930_i0~~NODE_2028_length_1300_cov_21.754476_g1930_i0.p1  ORF type:complete len:404 (-),score=113.19 NODE_2028_length_1300_cov_21.754476_g1930_i0:87-1274(-)
MGKSERRTGGLKAVSLESRKFNPLVKVIQRVMKKQKKRPRSKRNRAVTEEITSFNDTPSIPSRPAFKTAPPSLRKRDPSELKKKKKDKKSTKQKGQSSKKSAPEAVPESAPPPLLPTASITLNVHLLLLRLLQQQFPYLTSVHFDPQWQQAWGKQKGVQQAREEQVLLHGVPVVAGPPHTTTQSDVFFKGNLKQLLLRYVQQQCPGMQTLLDMEKDSFSVQCTPEAHAQLLQHAHAQGQWLGVPWQAADLPALLYARLPCKLNDVVLRLFRKELRGLNQMQLNQAKWTGGWAYFDTEDAMKEAQAKGTFKLFGLVPVKIIKTGNLCLSMQFDVEYICEVLLRNLGDGVTLALHLDHILVLFPDKPHYDRVMAHPYIDIRPLGSSFPVIPGRSGEM